MSPQERRDSSMYGGEGVRSRLLPIASLLGLAAASFLGALRTFGGDDPFFWEQLPGNLVFTAVYAAPYLMALHVWRSRVVRGHIALLSATILSFLATFSALSGVSLVLLPATVALAWATVRAWRQAGLGPGALALHLVAALVPMMTVGAAFAALFLLSEDPRCWGLPSGSACTSDIIVPWEARVGLGCLLLGFGVIRLAVGRASRREDGPR